MTLCVAAVCRKDENAPYIVTASDYLLSSGITSTEARMPKYAYASPWEPHSWGMMYSGDPTTAKLILSYAFQILKEKTSETTCGVEAVMAAYEEAFQRTLARIAEDRYLGRLLTNMEHFRSFGKDQLGEKAFLMLLKKIERVKLSVDVLIAGFSVNGKPSIFKVSDDFGVATDFYDQIGYAAIGQGAIAAEHSMDALFDPIAPLDEIIYRVAEAKFKGELARSVGSSTLITVHSHTGNWHRITTEDADRFRGAWMERYKSVPKDISAAMEGSLKTIIWPDIGKVSNQQERETRIRSSPDTPDPPFTKNT